MFTRTVEVTPKSGKARELANTINEKVLPRFSGETQHGWAPGPGRACSYPKKEGPGMSAKNVKTLRAAHESWNKRDFAGVVSNAVEDLA